MNKCDNCRLRKESAKAFDIHWLGEDDCPYDKCPVPDFPKTNADRIRSMTDEELAEFISGKARTFGEEYEGYMSALDWLKEECDDG